MKAKDDLYKLIRSLSKSEKRYFTIDAQKSGDRNRNYLSLFQVLNEMELYDEKWLKSQFPNLSSDKAYLYDAILRSMRDYRSPKSMVARIKEFILDAKFLYERGLYDQSEERLLTAKSLAIEIQDNYSLLEINREERRLKKEMSFQSFKDNFNIIIGEKDAALRGITSELLYLDFYDHLTVKVVEVFKLSDEQAKAEFRQDWAAHFAVQPASGQALLRYLQVNAFYNHLLGDEEKANDYFFKTVTWWDENPSIKREEFFRYIIDLSNFLSVLLRSGQHDKFLAVLDRLEKEKPDNFHEEGLLFQKVAFYKLSYFLKTGDYASGRSMIAAIEQGIKTFYIKEGTMLSIQYQVGLLLFFLKDYRNSKLWWEKIFAYKDQTIRTDIRKAARVLHLICVIETEELDAIESAYRANYRFLKANFKGTAAKFEVEICHRLKKIPPLHTAESKKQLQQLQQFLQNEWPSGQAKGIPLGFEEVKYWAVNRL